MLPNKHKFQVELLLDSGVNTSHYDLVNTVEQCKDFTGSTPLVNGSCTDGNGHGTHVAGESFLPRLRINSLRPNVVDTNSLHYPLGYFP